MVGILTRDITTPGVTLRDRDNLSTVLWNHPAGAGFIAISGCSEDPDGNYYISKRDTVNNGVIEKLDSNGNSLWVSPSLGQIPLSTSVDPSGNVYTTTNTNNSIRQVLANGSLGWTNTDPTLRVRNCRYCADGFVYAVSWDGGIYKINATTGITARTDNPAGGNDMDFIVVDPDGSYYVWDRTVNQTIAVDPTGSVSWTLPDSVPLGNDENFVFCRKESNRTNFYKVDKATGSILATHVFALPTSGTSCVDQASGTLFQATDNTGAAPYTLHQFRISDWTELTSQVVTNREIMANLGVPAEYGSGMWPSEAGSTGFNLGLSTVDDVKLGASPVDKVLLGSLQVFPSLVDIIGGTFGAPDFISSPIDPGAAQVLVSAAHGLGSAPTIVIAEWERISTGNGYQAGEKIYWAATSYDQGTAIAESGQNVGYSATDVWAVLGANHAPLPDGSGTPDVYADLRTNFQVRFYAWNVAPDFVSSDFGTPIIADQKFSAAHGLGSTPKYVVEELICVIAEDGYSPGDVIQHQFIGLFNNNANFTTRGHNVGYNSTEVFSLMATANLINKTTGQNTGVPTNGNWEYRLKAWDLIAPAFKNVGGPYVPLTRLSAAHGLEDVDFVLGELVCNTPEQNWAVGDRLVTQGMCVDPNSPGTNSNQIWGGITGNDNAGNVFFLAADDGIVALDKNTPTAVTGTVINPANWDVELSAWGTFPFLSQFYQSGFIFNVDGLQVRPDDLAFGNNGLKLYTVDGATDSIHEYDLTSPYDIRTASLNFTKSVASVEVGVKGIDWNPDGLTFFICGIGNNRIIEWNCTTPWDVSTATFSTIFTPGAELPLADCRSLRFNGDGSKLFVSGGDNVTVSTVVEYDLPTNYTLAGITYNGVSLDTTAIDNQPRAIDFNSDGTKLLIAGTEKHRIYQLDLAAPYDIASAQLRREIQTATTSMNGLAFAGSDDTFITGHFFAELIEWTSLTAPSWPLLTSFGFSGFSNSVAAQETSPRTHYFTEDGLRMFVLGANVDAVLQYTLTEPFNISTATYDAISFSVTLQDSTPTGIAFSNGGNKMWMLGSATDSIYQYTLGNPYNLSSGVSYDSVSLNITGFESTPQEIHAKPDGSRLYFVGNTPEINQLDLSTYRDLTTWSHAGQFALPEIALALYFKPDGSKFYFAGLSGTIYEYNMSTPWDISTAVASGLTFDVSGQGIPQGIHVSDAGDLLVTIEAAGSTYLYKSGPSDWTVLQLSYNSKNVTFNALGLGTNFNPQGMTMKPDGTRALVVTGSTDRVVQIDFSTAYDVTSASYSAVDFSVLAQEASAQDIFVRDDGLKFYITGASGSVYQFSMGSAWDLSTASYDSISFSVAAQESNPYALSFSPDGLKMFVVGAVADAVFMWDLGVAWDISSAVYSGDSFSVAGADGQNRGIVFNDDGSRMYLTGIDNDTIQEYELGIAYDITTASLFAVFDISGQAGTPNGVTWSSDGLNAYVVDGLSDALYQYEI